jgi:hypothetical protein
VGSSASPGKLSIACDGVGTGEYDSGVRWKKPQGIRALRLRAGFKNRLCMNVPRPGLYRLASTSRERESKMLFHQRNNSSVATRTHRVNGVDIDAQEVDLDVAGC